MNLKFCCMWGLCDGQITPGHPQKVMKELGIDYEIAVPQSLYDSWWFFNCRNIPDELPGYLSELKGKPTDFIGYGLSENDALSLEGKK